jgi:Heterodisulfide reductase, subunit A and related polyferredoxins
MPANRVLVIGAGPAGLSATKELQALGVDVVLVERESYLGGTPKKLKYSLLFPELRPASEVLDPLIKAGEAVKTRYMESIVDKVQQEETISSLPLRTRTGRLIPRRSAR